MFSMGMMSFTLHPIHVMGDVATEKKGDVRDILTLLSPGDIHQ